MSFRYIFEPLRILATKLVLAFDRPETVVKTLEKFEELFRDESNFIDVDKWGEMDRHRYIRPFSLSASGMAKIRQLKKDSSTFDKIYRAGIAHMGDQKYSLLYFLTQYLIVATSIGQYMGIMAERDGLDSLKEKAQKIESIPLNLKELYQSKIPNKKYSEEEAKKAKDMILDLIRNFKQSFKALEPMSPEEKKYFQDK